jgi:hypothetical protein
VANSLEFWSVMTIPSYIGKQTIGCFFPWDM